MLESALAACYFVSVSSIVYNIVRAKLQDDWDAQIKELKEFDIQTDRVKVDLDLPSKVVLLANYVPKEEEKTENTEDNDSQKDKTQPIFSESRSFANILDPTRFFETRFTKKTEFKLDFGKESVQDYPLEIQFNRRHKTSFFDLETLGRYESSEAKSIGRGGLLDQLEEFYFTKLRGRHAFGFINKGISSSKPTELLVVGELTFCQKSQKLLMQKPELVIGSDRMELYEFFARRKETWGTNNRNLIKVGFGLTFAHFLLVRIPTLFSRYFGDNVGEFSQKLGAEDQRDVNAKLQRIKEVEEAKKTRLV